MPRRHIARAANRDSHGLRRSTLASGQMLMRGMVSGHAPTMRSFSRQMWQIGIALRKLTVWIRFGERA